PHVQEHDVALVVGECLRLCHCLDRRRPEIRRLGSDRDREELAAKKAGRCEEPTAQDEHHDADESPLLPNGHTVTPHRPRSSPIYCTGSCAEKIAFPATKVSAPARQQSPIVSRAIPPSTSRAAPLRAASSIALARRILSSIAPMNDCPPKPGFTVMTSRRSRSPATSLTISSGVDGFTATPAQQPSSLMR